MPLTKELRALPALFLVASILTACTSESSQVPPGPASSNHPPEIRTAHLLPSPVTLNGVMSVQIEADDPDRNPVTFHYRWFVNGKPIPAETQATLDPRFLKRGDTVAVEVTPLDSYMEGKPYRTVEMKVGNTPPEVRRIMFEPSELHVGSQLEAKIEVVDLDHDNVHMVYRWKRNKNIVLEGDYPIIDASPFLRGDELVVEVIPSDQYGQGTPVSSDPVTIANGLPTVTSNPPTEFQNGLYVYDVRAVDRDQDPLKYTLEIAPPGMTINQATGHIEWRPASDARGSHRVRVTVSDQQGGNPAFQDFELTLPLPPAS